MKKLNWKKKYLADNSGYWYEAKVQSINWKYVVETNFYDENLYSCYLFENKFADEIQISKKKYKALEAAQNFCQKHIESIAIKLKKELNNE